MKPNETSDRQFEDNLAAFGAEHQSPEVPTDEVRARCLATLNFEYATASHGNKKRCLRRSALFSTVGIAASIALLMGFLHLSSPNGKVEAAVILQRLSDQFQQNPLVDMTFKAVRLHGVFIDGRVTVSKAAATGDLRVRDEEEADEMTDVDLAFAASADQTWLLFRKLVVPDARAQAILGWLIPPGQDVLLKLPHNEVDNFSMDLSLVKLDFLAEAVQSLIEAGDRVGASVTSQPDGTILLEIPLKDESSLEAMRLLHEQLSPPSWPARFHRSPPRAGLHFATSLSAGVDSDEAENTQQQDANQATETKTKRTVTLGFKIGGDDAHEFSDDEPDPDEDHHALYGSTFWVVYDPAAKIVGSLGIRDIGPDAGSITMDFRQGDIDPALMDSGRVTKENTRILDLAALEKLFHGSENSEEK